ncbi:DUF6284 family protein [Micromonospora sp. WMMA1363]|uniref:DUF6284 family protein n=1 Tax=Micromonospora sp. WMMA1363 TaxID=3053985 RepID=UPI00259D22E6|nr:DUF6284 family protein [Micromonospora sp. WMMA1363]MDM4721338.1 DUF6284 family protein [Micromonospora sp. WMMA1363]
MSVDLHYLDGLEGPSMAELAEIEAEVPLIEAEVEWLDAQITVLAVGLNEVTRQMVRRARRERLRAACTVLAARAVRPRCHATSPDRVA